MKVALKMMLLAAGASLVVSLPTRAQDSPEAAAQKIMSQAREALGGDAKFKSVQSLSYNGKSRRMVRRMMMMGPGGENAPPPAPTLQENDFEVDVLTPDKYVRRDTRELNFNNNIATIISYTGFNGDTPIQRTETIGDLPFNPNQMQFGGGPDAAAQVRAAKQGFVRAWLGFAFEPPSAYGLAYRSTGQETVNNAAYDVVEAIGPDNFSAKLFYDAASHRLTMIRYKTQVPQGGPQFTRMGGPPPGGTPSGSAPPAGGPPAGEGQQQRMMQRPSGPMQDMEIELTFSDYKNVDGIQLPHKIRRSMNGEMNEETEVKKFKINSNPKADKFKTAQ